MILDECVWITLSPINVKWYEDKGYYIPRKRNKWHKIQYHRGIKIAVRVEDLMYGSNVKVWRMCVICCEIKQVKYSEYSQYCCRCNRKSAASRELAKLTNSGEKNPNWKGGFPNCKICGKKISRGATYCITCMNHLKRNPKLNEFQRYRSEVMSETKKHIKRLYLDWNGTDYYSGEKLITTIEYKILYPNKNICSNLLQPCVDHKISVKFGFDNNIDPKIIGNIKNLTICSRYNNNKKFVMNEDEFKAMLSK